MAYDVEFILEKLSEVVQLSKKSDIKDASLELKGNSILLKTNQDKTRPPYTPNYSVKIEMMERIKNHAELNSFPEKIFIAKAPRQTPEELEYIRANYKQVTLPVYMDYLSTINRIFHDTNYNITYAKEEYPEGTIGFQEYVETKLPVYGSLESFVKSILPHVKSTDANGIIAVRPYETKYVESEEGEYVIDDTFLFEPIPIYYSCAQIVAEEADEFYMVETNEKSEVFYYDKVKKIGKVYEFYDSQNIYKITQVGKYTDSEFQVELILNHNSGQVPCIKLQGIPTLSNGELMYVSPFNYSVDLLDLVAMNSSYLQVVINNCVFPFRVMYGDVCEFEYIDRNGERSLCSSGWVYDSNLQNQTTCPSCNGSGLKSRVSPLGVMLLKPRTSTSEGDSGLGQAPMQYIEPTMATPEFLMKKIDNDEYKARKILHLHTSTSAVKGGETLATDMMLDLKALYAFVKPISDQIFSIWEFIANQIGYQRYGSSFESPSFTYPISFDFNTEKDYTYQISQAISSGMPPFVLQSILWKYLQTIYYNEKKTTSIFNLIYNADRLLPFTNEEIALKQGRGNVDKWEVILHDSALSFVDELIIEVESFLELPFQEQKEMLIEKAKLKQMEIDKTGVEKQNSIIDMMVSKSSKVADDIESEDYEIEYIDSEDEAEEEVENEPEEIISTTEGTAKSINPNA